MRTSLRPIPFRVSLADEKKLAEAILPRLWSRTAPRQSGPRRDSPGRAAVVPDRAATVRAAPRQSGPRRNICIPFAVEATDLDTQQQSTGSLRAALTPAALRAALIPRRPVYANPWDSTADMFACYVAVAFVDPLLLWCGGELMGGIFGFASRWHLGVFMAAAFVGAAGFITIVGRERTSLAVDILAVSAWLLLGLVVAPILGLAPSIPVAIACYAVLVLAILVYVLRLGSWETAFLHTLSWPITWSLLALFFAFSAYRLILYQ
jgi:hypothetical protein